MTALWLFAISVALALGFWLGGRHRDDVWIGHAGAHAKLERRRRRYHVVADHDYLGCQLISCRIQGEIAVRERADEAHLKSVVDASKRVVDAADRREARRLQLVKNRERGPYKPN
jgi:hypothetical protein